MKDNEKEALEKFLKSKKIYSKFKKNITRITYLEFTENLTHITGAIRTAFVWHDSTEGREYWEDVNTEWLKYIRINKI